ncbi:9343_t:CDS:2 [Rhizophagus irregularis]|nr:9343_t:CDS:2 [Rhizophagus irregularis]
MKTTKRILDLEEKSSISIKQERKYFSNGINININIGRPKSPILDSSTTPTSESSSQGQKPKPEGKCNKEDNDSIKKTKKRKSLSKPFKFNYFYQKDPLKYSQISLHHEPLFIYPKYLRGLNYNNFDSAIKNYCYWNRPLINPLTDSLDELKFSKEIRTLLHNNDYYIDNNEINEINSNNDNNNNDIPIMITGINTFTRLTTLDLSYMYSSEISKIIPQQISNICSHLSTHSTHIQCLTIYMQKWWEDDFKQQVCLSIFNLIKSQKYLKYLSINEFWNTNYNNFNNFDNTTIEYFNKFYQILLENTSNTLEYLQFYELNRFDLLLNILDPTLIPDFCALLVSLPKLHSLTIKKSFYRLSFNYIDFKNLAINLPNSLYYFKTDLFDNSKSLNYFLETCNIDVKLGVLEIYQQLVNDDTLNAILNYKKKSNDKLKTFKYSGSRIMFNDQTWELTKKILPDL